MPERMAAAVNHGPGDYCLEEVAPPHAEPGEVVIRMEVAGVCGSDAKCHAGASQCSGRVGPAGEGASNTRPRVLRHRRRSGGAWSRGARRGAGRPAGRPP